MKKKVISSLLCMAMLVSLLSGCGTKTDTPAAGTADEQSVAVKAGENVESPAEGAQKYPEFITVDVFASLANYQGIQGGWFGEIVKEKFNMELNIIAPNVAGGGDTLYQTRSAAGNLGDIICAPAAGGKLQDLVTAGLLTEMSPYFSNQANLNEYRSAIDKLNGELVTEDGIWAIPTQVSKKTALDGMATTDFNNGIYIRWDLYKQLGYPEMDTMEDLLTVMKDMKDIAGKSDSGKDVYAFSIFKDWDGALINAGCMLGEYYGMAADNGFVISKADNSEPATDALADNSPYIRGLKFFFQANQMGLLDPESATQNYDTLFSKYEDGAILFAPWPWLGASAYNTANHTEQGKAFKTASIKDLKLREWGCNPDGDSNAVMMVGSKAQDPQRMVDFIDWLYSPEGNQLGGNEVGVVEEMYEMVDGKPELTQLGIDALVNGNATMPEKYGGGNYKDGKNQLNIKIISSVDINPLTGETYTYETWESYINARATDVDKDWQEFMGAKNAVEYFTKNNQVCISPGAAWTAPADSTDITTMRSQIGEVIKEYSWKAIFAADENEFNALIAEMTDLARGLGYDEVIEVDYANHDSLQAARDAVTSGQ